MEDLSKLGIGCYWDSFFAGSVYYADDLVLLAPSLSALRIMLHCCEDFAINCSLRFNPSKTQLIRFSHSPSSTIALLTFTSVISFSPFLTLSHTSRAAIFFIIISMTLRMLIPNFVTW